MLTKFIALATCVLLGTTALAAPLEITDAWGNPTGMVTGESEDPSGPGGLEHPDIYKADGEHLTWNEDLEVCFLPLSDLECVLIPLNLVICRGRIMVTSMYVAHSVVILYV
jgi:hypothetical protein